VLISPSSVVLPTLIFLCMFLSFLQCFMQCVRASCLWRGKFLWNGLYWLSKKIQKVCRSDPGSCPVNMNDPSCCAASPFHKLTFQFYQKGWELICFVGGAAVERSLRWLETGSFRVVHVVVWVVYNQTTFEPTSFESDCSPSDDNFWCYKATRMVYENEQKHGNFHNA
jgi:hypothetical protein